MLYFM